MTQGQVKLSRGWGGTLDNWACFHSVNGMGLLMAHLSMVLGPVQSS